MKMRSYDKRLELRLPGDEKDALERAAQERGVTVSALMRSALRSHLKRPEPLSREDASAVAALRRRINAIECRHGASSELAQARVDAQRMLGR